MVPRDRKFILDTLIRGLERLEYRGYDSTGIFLTHFTFVANLFVHILKNFLFAGIGIDGDVHLHGSDLRLIK